MNWFTKPFILLYDTCLFCFACASSALHSPLPLYTRSISLITYNTQSRCCVIRGPDSTAEDSTAEHSLPTTLRWIFFQNADSTADVQ